MINPQKICGYLTALTGGVCSSLSGSSKEPTLLSTALMCCGVILVTIGGAIIYADETEKAEEESHLSNLQARRAGTQQKINR